MSDYMLILLVTLIVICGVFMIDRALRKTDEEVQERAYDYAVLAIQRGHCPSCRKSGTLLMGPSGGMSQNVACNNCLEEFNVHFSLGNGALGVDRSGHLTESRAAVFGIDRDEYRQIERERFYGVR